jgi:hypothetical protein
MFPFPEDGFGFQIVHHEIRCEECVAPMACSRRDIDNRLAHRDEPGPVCNVQTENIKSSSRFGDGRLNATFRQGWVGFKIESFDGVWLCFAPHLPNEAYNSTGLSMRYAEVFQSGTSLYNSLR